MDNEDNNHPTPGNGPQPLEPWVDPAMEARLVALALGEASDFESAELEAALESQPELQAFYDRILTAHGFLVQNDAADGESWKLPTGVREDLLKKFRAVDAPTEETPEMETVTAARRKSGALVPWLSVAAAVVLSLSALLLLTREFGLKSDVAKEQKSVHESAAGEGGEATTVFFADKMSVESTGGRVFDTDMWMTAIPPKVEPLYVADRRSDRERESSTSDTRRNFLRGIESKADGEDLNSYYAKASLDDSRWGDDTDETVIMGYASNRSEEEATERFAASTKGKKKPAAAAKAAVPVAEPDLTFEFGGSSSANAATAGAVELMDRELKDPAADLADQNSDAFGIADASFTDTPAGPDASYDTLKFTAGLRYVDADGDGAPGREEFNAPEDSFRLDNHGNEVSGIIVASSGEKSDPRVVHRVTADDKFSRDAKWDKGQGQNAAATLAGGGPRLFSANLDSKSNSRSPERGELSAPGSFSDEGQVELDRLYSFGKDKDFVPPPQPGSAGVGGGGVTGKFTQPGGGDGAGGEMAATSGLRFGVETVDVETVDSLLGSIPDAGRLDQPGPPIDPTTLANKSSELAERIPQLAPQGEPEASESLEKSLSLPAGEADKKRKEELLKTVDESEFSLPVTPLQAEVVAETERKLKLATDFFDAGRYDDAVKHYDSVLQADRYNEAARRGKEGLELARQGQYKNGRDHMRSKVLSDTGKLWDSGGSEGKPELLALQEETIEEAGEKQFDPVAPSGTVSDSSKGLVTGSGTIKLFGNGVGADRIAELESLKSNVNQLKDLEGESLFRAAAGLGINNETLKERLPEYEAAIEERKALLDSGLAENHPKVQRQEQSIEQLGQIIGDSVAVTRETLGTQLKMAKQSFGELEAAKSTDEKDSEIAARIQNYELGYRMQESTEGFEDEAAGRELSKSRLTRESDESLIAENYRASGKRFEWEEREQEVNGKLAGGAESSVRFGAGFSSLEDLDGFTSNENSDRPDDVKKFKEEEFRQRSGQMMSLHASVASVNNSWGFTILNSGENQGITSGAKLDVQRGGEKIAELQVTSLEKNRSVTDIVKGSIAPGEEIRPGDKVVLSEFVPGEDYVDVSGIQQPMLTAVLPTYEKLSGKRIIVDESITDADTMTLVADRLLSGAEATRFYEDNLLMHGYAVLPVDENTNKLVSLGDHQANVLSHSPILRDGDEVPDTDDTVIYLMNLEHVSADEATRHFSRVAGDLPDGGFAIAPDGSTIVITQPARTIRQLIEARDEIDTLERKEQLEANPDFDLETLTTKEPFSTFSLNVSDVSFKLAKTALLDNNTFPEAAKIRPEEFVNALDYGDPQPTLDEKVGCQVEQAAHPFLQQRNLMRVAMQTAAAGRSATQPLRLTILLDKSGSMEREDREESVLRTMQALSKHLGPADQVSAIAFARTPHLVADRLSGDRAPELVGLVAATPSEGGTNLESALELADTLATRQFEDGAINRIVLITDGAANLGDADPESLKERVIELRERGIAFDACGVGADGLNDTALEALTRKGDGRYYFLNRPEDADANFVRQLAGSLRPAAKNVKVQVKFNPERVARYRLVGFEKHRLKKEDFRNDSVDAAEMAAAESGNALYQFEADPQGSGDVGEVFVRFLDTASGKMVERSWPIPYQAKAPRLEDAMPSLQLAATAGLLAEKLKGGAVADAIQLQDLAPTTIRLRASCGEDERVNELIQMVEKTRALIGE